MSTSEEQLAEVRAELAKLQQERVELTKAMGVSRNMSETSLRDMAADVVKSYRDSVRTLEDEVERLTLEAKKADQERAFARHQLAQVVNAAGVVIDAFKFTEHAGELGVTHYTLPADAVVPFKTLYKRCKESPELVVWLVENRNRKFVDNCLAYTASSKEEAVRWLRNEDPKEWPDSYWAVFAEQVDVDILADKDFDNGLTYYGLDGKELQDDEA